MGLFHSNNCQSNLGMSILLDILIVDGSLPIELYIDNDFNSVSKIQFVLELEELHWQLKLFTSIAFHSNRNNQKR